MPWHVCNLPNMKIKKEYIKANSLLFLTMLGYSLVTALLSVYLSSRGISLANIGLIFSVGVIIAGLFRIPIGILIDCLGRKKFLIIGAIGYPLFAAGLIYASAVGHFIFLNLLVEFFGAIFWTAFSAHFFDIMSKGEEGVGMAGRNITLYTAAGIAPIIAGLLATNFGFTNLFMIGAAIAASGILVTLTVKDHNHAKKLCYVAMHEEYARILKIKGLPLIAAIIFLVDFMFVFWGIFMPIWLRQQGMSFEAIGLILSANLLLTVFLQIPIGKAIDKWPVRNILIPGFIMFWLGGALFFTFKNFYIYLLNRTFLVGTGSDMAYWPAVSMLAKLTPKVDNGGAVALIFGISASIKGFGALIGGFLTQRFGIQAVLIAVSYLALAAAIILIPFKILKKKGTQFHKVHHHRAHILNHRL